MKKILFFLAFAAVVLQTSTAQKLSENAQISLLTCGAGEQIYEQFGHTAIRIVDTTLNLDVAFNYGMFDFNTENFQYKFVRGLTDYWVGADDTGRFLYRYFRRDIVVWEQTLNLRQDEKQWLFNALVKNTQPENRYYRYNFIFDNCATRPRDMIEFALRDSIVYPDLPATSTFRELIGEYTGNTSWGKFSIDLVLGSAADRVVTPRERMFLPSELMNYLQGATRTNGERIVLEKSVTVDLEPRAVNNPTASPLLVCSAFMILVFLLTFFLRNKKTYWLDAVLFSVSGIIGIIIFYISYFSVHPLVESNFNLLWLNPLQFVFVLLLPFKKLRKALSYYQILNALAIIVAIAGYLFLPQQFNAAFLPLMLTLLVRALMFVRNSFLAHR